jgi:hypothetical protein
MQSSRGVSLVISDAQHAQFQSDSTPASGRNEATCTLRVMKSSCGLHMGTISTLPSGEITAFPDLNFERPYISCELDRGSWGYLQICPVTTDE